MLTIRQWEIDAIMAEWEGVPLQEILDMLGSGREIEILQDENDEGENSTDNPVRSKRPSRRESYFD